MKSIAWASALVVGILVGPSNGRPLVNKRALVTEVVYVTETVANVAVYVDENGTPYSTSTEVIGTSVPNVAVSTTSALPQPTSEHAPVPQPPSSSPPAAAPVTSSSAPFFTVVTTSSVEPSSVGKDEASVSATSEAPVSTSAEAQAPNTSTTTEAPAPSSVEAQPITTPPPPTSTSYQAPPPPSSSAVPADTKGDDGSLGLGVTYDVFTGQGQNSQCKSTDQMTSELAQLKDFKAIRIYSNDCDSVPLVVQSAVKNNQKLTAGIYLPLETSNDVIQVYKNAIDQYADGDWSVIALFSVENERVASTEMTASAVIDAINQARGQLRSFGYNGPVGATETVPALTQNPAICQAADVVMANIHAFFDGNVLPDGAGPFVQDQVNNVKKACHKKRVVVTESGWPHQGDRNNNAVPSPENQKTAIASLRKSFDRDLFLFNAFDSMWKSNSAGTFNAEQYWGIM